MRVCQVVACGIVAAMLSGCDRPDRPPMGRVCGFVTLDGEPLPDVAVVFRPTEGGRQSTASTNEDGHYELSYVDVELGCPVGTHEVYLSTGLSEDEPGGPRPELIPSAYRGRAKLTKEVKSGKNEINFELVNRQP
ncbi:MAG: carboxypeptidase regulatory-like domain-containing protein [Planctomycetaceae bacterium]|nr:carboxypeptidase regulatory-like domain-containing protein [Planctomycetaceae bacterium]